MKKIFLFFLMICLLLNIVNPIYAQEEGIYDFTSEITAENIDYDEDLNTLNICSQIEVSNVIIMSGSDEIVLNDPKKNEDKYVFELVTVPNGTYQIKEIVYCLEDNLESRNVENLNFFFTIENGIEYLGEQEEIMKDKIAGFSLSIQGHIGVNCFFYLSESTLNNPNTYVQFILSNGTIYKVSIANAKESYGYTMFTFYIPVKEIAQPFEVILYSKGTEQISYKYNMNKYFNYILEYEKDSKIVNITKSIMTYAYYAQQYFDYNLDSLPSYKNQLTDLNLESYKYTLKDQSDELDFVGARLKLNSKPCLKIYFSGNGVFTVDGSVVTTKKEGQYSVIVLEDIDDMEHMFLIESDNYSLTYGIYSYAYSAFEKQSNKAMDLLKAMIAYNETLIHEYTNKPIRIKVLFVLDEILKDNMEYMGPIEVKVITDSRENKGNLNKENGWQQEFVLNTYEIFSFDIDFSKCLLVKDTKYEWDSTSNTAIFYLYGKK